MAPPDHPVPITDADIAACRYAWLRAMGDGEPARDVARLFGEHEALRESQSRQIAERILTMLRRA